MAITNLVHSEADVLNCPHPQPDGDHITPHINLKHSQQQQLNGPKKHVHWEDLEYVSDVGEQGSALRSKNSPVIVSSALGEETLIKLEPTPNPASTVDQANIDFDDEEGSVVKKEKKPCPSGPSRPMTRSVTTGLRSQTGCAVNAELPKRVGKHNPCFRCASIPVICEPEGVSISLTLQEGFSIVDMRLRDLSKAVKEVVGKLDARRPNGT
ncbi:hypothetical protein AN958_11669 [Leucoagaricus sp. SymC.cos]|nr:hypothetical protein AN958_11669 [Leucoagaricus sp. SymC.cos]